MTTQEFSYTYQFHFVPRTTGPLTVPPVTVRLGNQTAETPVFEIEVVGPEPQDWAGLEIATSDHAVYPGQTVTLWVDVYLRRLKNQGELLEANPFSSREPPQIKIPWLGGTDPAHLATAAAIVGTSMFAIGLALSFFLPEPNSLPLSE